MSNEATNEKATTETAPPSCAPAKGYVHPSSILEFESVYRKEYEQELASCDRWIKWCSVQEDWYGKNFHQGRRSALVFNDMKMHQLLRVLKQEPPNARSGHNDRTEQRRERDESKT